MINAIHPLLAAGGLQFAFARATTEGKITILVLIVLSLLSWTIIISKSRQLFLATKLTRHFLAAYAAEQNLLKLDPTHLQFQGAPAFELYSRGTAEVQRLLASAPGSQRISATGFELVKTTLEEAATAEAINLERGMIVLSIAVAGGPFIGLLGTVWGVMETFAGIAQTNAATLTAMAPGVAAALIATVAGLLVAIPAMFAYNLMVTSIRHITQELDAFAARFATQIKLTYVEQKL